MKRIKRMIAAITLASTLIFGAGSLVNVRADQTVISDLDVIAGSQRTAIVDEDVVSNLQMATWQGCKLEGRYG